MTMASRSSSPLVTWSLALLCALVGVGAAAAFLPHQSLWIDETTQLSGVAMGPARVVRWLTGHEQIAGVAPDRSPPVSYWVGQAWAAAFGHGMVSLRWLGATCAGLAAACVFAAGRRAYGVGTGVAAGLLFALSPNVVTYGIEVRAYPIFLLVSTAAVWAFVEQLIAEDDRGRARSLAVMTALCVVATYVHFFGLVLSGALLSASVVARLRNGQRLRPAIMGGAVVAVAAVGLYPFVTASVTVSQYNLPEPVPSGGRAGREAREVAHLLYRLVGHPATSVSRVATVAAILGAAVLVSLALCAALRRDKPAGSPAPNVTLGLVAALGLGLIAVSAASFVVKSFHTAAPHYNSWMLPCLCVLAAGGLRAVRGKLHWIACLALAAAIAGETSGTVRLARRGDAFAHGPYSRLAAVVERLGPSHVIVILDGPDTTIAGGVYFPFRFLFGASVPQYVVTSADRPEPQVRIFDPPDSRSMPLSDVSVKPGDYVLVIASRNVSANELANRLRHHDLATTPLLPPGPASRWFASDAGRWKQIEAREYLSLVGAHLDVYRRTPQPPPT